MFDLSLIETVVIALVALIVLGPERLPRAAQTVGLMFRRARSTWFRFRGDIERELAADELRRALQDERAALMTLKDEVAGLDRDLRQALPSRVDFGAAVDQNSDVPATSQKGSAEPAPSAAAEPGPEDNQPASAAFEPADPADGLGAPQAADRERRG